jgi:hypothetical protein
MRARRSLELNSLVGRGKMNRGLLILFLIVLITGEVTALGITPGRTTFDFDPGTERKVDFSVINSGNKDMDLIVLVQGELNESISVSEVSFSMSSSEESRSLSYNILIPSTLTPGLHNSEILVIQLPGKSPTSEAFLGAAVGVATQVRIFVPFPGKYAEASLNVIGPEENGEITFVIPVVNRGKLDLTRVRGTIDIFSSLNEKVATVDANEIQVQSEKRGEIVVVWDSGEVLPGPYRAIATVLYDEDVLTLEKEFNIGTRLLELLGIEVNDFSLGGIAKFEMFVENKWGEDLTGVYAQMQVHNDEGEVMADFKSSTYDIPPLSKTLITSFWDTDGVREGTYESSLFLKYGQSSEQQDFKLEVSDTNINVIGIGYVISSSGGGGSANGMLVTVLIIVLVVLVILNLLWFLVLRKKLSRRK